MAHNVQFSCGCAYWFVRSITLAAITLAWVFSLLALKSCELFKGEAMYYYLDDEDKIFPQNSFPSNSSSTSTSTEPKDTYNEPQRERPGYQTSSSFTIGVYKAKDYGGYTSKCLPYDHGYYDQYLDAGGAEGAAKAFGTIAAILGGISMVVFCGMAATEVRSRTPLRVFSCILFASAIFQALIFILGASEHCGDDFWKEFISEREQNELLGTTVYCELGEGGWFAVTAIILFLFSSLVVMLKWHQPEFALWTMEWTKADGTGTEKATETAFAPVPTMPQQQYMQQSVPQKKMIVTTRTTNYGPGDAPDSPVHTAMSHEEEHDLQAVDL